LNIGELRHRVQIQSAEITTDATGQQIKTWSTVAARWAKVEQLHGKENYRRSGERTTTSYKILMRYEDNLLSTNKRIVYGDHILDIESFIDLKGDKVAYEVMCSGDSI